jgi:hypothetical protein
MNKIMHYMPYHGPEYQNRIYDVVIERSNCVFSQKVEVNDIN